MRRKVGTVLDGRLYQRLKVEAARRGKRVSEALTEAVERYLGVAGDRAEALRHVEESFGSIRVDPAFLHQMMHEEPDWLEA